MKDWEKTIIPQSASLRDTIESIERSKSQIALVVDEARRLAGVVTDGDIRRAILVDADLSQSILGVMNARPTSGTAATPRWRILNMMREKGLHHLPLLDDQRRVIDLISLDELVGSIKLPNHVVIMAGGVGKRLHPLTENTPKPMLRIDEKPILESILESLTDQGFNRFVLAVNYMAETITDHFGDGSRWGVEIEYIREKEHMGTAGALSLLPAAPEHPLVIMNGDILTRLDVNEMLKFHSAQNVSATMAIREYEVQIPYGVLTINEGQIVEIVEKPVHRYFVNAGVYILSPSALSHIPTGRYFDMPMLFENLIAASATTGVYPIRDYWIDVGKHEELEKARQEWPNE